MIVRASRKPANQRKTVRPLLILVEQCHSVTVHLPATVSRYDHAALLREKRHHALPRRPGDVLPQALQPSTVDFVVTDPPYGLGFMEKDWDFDVPGPAYWKTIRRLCKPGALLLAFGGTGLGTGSSARSRMPGWEIRDCLMWLYGQGFPKSLDISKALDKAAGAEREIVGRRSHRTSAATATRTGSGTARPATSKFSTPFRPQNLPNAGTVGVIPETGLGTDRSGHEVARWHLRAERRSATASPA